MIFVQYYQWSTGYSEPPKPIEMCGTDSVLRLDGRLNRTNQHRMAQEHASKMLNKPIGYKIRKGTSYSDSWPITTYVSLLCVTDDMKRLAEKVAKAQEAEHSSALAVPSTDLLLAYGQAALDAGFSDIRWPGLYPEVMEKSGHWRPGW